MITATIRDFKIRATGYLKSREEVLITRHGQPVALLSPVKKKSVEAALLELRRIISEAGISKKKLLGLLKESRKEVYHN
jgi:prevent-host-death family protein